MPERRVEGRESAPKKVITICNARLVWKSPGLFPDTSFFYVSDEEGFFITPADVERVAVGMVNGRGLAAPLYTGGQEPEINHEAPEEAIVVWTHGYYRQPLLPAEIYALTDLDLRQAEELKSCLDRQRGLI